MAGPSFRPALIARLASIFRTTFRTTSRKALVLCPPLLGISLALYVVLAPGPQHVPVTAQTRPQTPSEALFALVVEGYATTPGADWHREIAEVYATLGQDDAALAHLSAAANETDDPALWRRLATAFLDRGQWRAAQDALQALLTHAPADPTAHYQLGVLLAPHSPLEAADHLLFARADPVLGEAALAIRAALSNTENDSPAYRSAQLGITLAGLAHWPQAEGAFDMATALDPGYADAWAYLGLARSMQGKDGLPAIDRALALAPDDPLALYLGGLVWRDAGDLAQSRVLLAEAQRLAPDNPAFAAELGAAYRLEGDFVAAESWMRAAIDLAPDDPGFLRILALFYAEELYNLDGDGMAVLREAVALLPADADLQAAYGWALYNQRQITAGYEAVNAALNLDPENPRALYYFALMQEGWGRTDIAIEAYLNLATHPDANGFDTLARRALERLGYQP